MKKKYKLISVLLMAVIAINMMGTVAATAGQVHTTINYNGCAKSSIVVYDSTNDNIYSEKHTSPDARKNGIKFTFNIPDSCKWHDIVVKFNHGIAGQGSSDYVTIPAFTDGDAYLTFETYGDDVWAEYKGLSNHWNDKHRNIFYLGQP